MIDRGGSKRWVMLYRMQGRRGMGLGSVSVVSMPRVRELAAAAWVQIAGGIDPIEVRAAAVARPPPPMPVTFAGVAKTYRADREQTWRNAAHRAQWRQTLKVQAASLRRMLAAEINTHDGLAVLRPIWRE